MESIAQILGLGIFFILAPVFLHLRRDYAPAKSHVGWFFAAFVVVAAAPFWMFGPASYFGAGDDAAYALPHLLHQARMPGAIVYDNAIAAGGDRALFAANVGSAGGLVSLHLLVYGLLPDWIANLFFRLLASAFAVTGAYALGLRFNRGDRLSAAIVATLFAFSFEWITTVSMWGGAGFALIPGIVYVAYFKLQARHYYLWMAMLAVVFSVVITPTHVWPPAMLALAAFWFLFDGAKPRRLYLGIALFAVLSLLNWIDYLGAMAATAPHSFRGFFGHLELFSAPRQVAEFTSRFGYLRVLLAAGLALQMIAWLVSGRLGWTLARCAAAAAATVAVPVALAAAPWQAWNLGWLGGYKFGYLTGAMIGIAPPVFAAGLAAAADLVSAMARRRATALAAAAVLALFTFEQGRTVITMTTVGGHRSLLAIPNLQRKDAWGFEPHYRTLTIPYRLSINTPTLYGMEAFDSYVVMPSRWYVQYWIDGLLPGLGVQAFDGGYIGLPERLLGDDLRRAQAVDLDAVFDVDLLRVANVRYVISRLPVLGAALRQVSGPDAATYRAFADRGFRQKLAYFADLIFDPPEVYIYEIAGALPRAYFARGVVRAGPDMPAPAFYRMIARQAPRRLVVSREALVAVDGAEAEVVAMETTADGMRAGVRAAAGGLLVFNLAYWPFLVAEVDGMAVPTTVVNGFQVAVRVAPGARSVRLRYRRPGLAAMIGADRG